MSTIFQVEQIKNILGALSSPSKKLTDGLYASMDSGYKVLNKPFFERRSRSNNDTADEIKNIITSRSVADAPRDGLRYSKVASDLMDTYLSNNKVIHDNEFRDMIFIDFMKNMSGMSFNDFVNIQTQNINLMPVHVKYLIETYEYLVMNKQRQVNNFTWLSLIRDMNSDTSNSAYKVKQYFNEQDTKKLIGLSGGENLVSIWISKDDGVVDLLYFNKLVFGISDAKGAL